jgi:hypothetical protein
MISTRALDVMCVELMIAADRVELKDKPSTSTATHMHSNNKTSFRVPTNVAVPKRNLVIVPKISSNSNQVPNKVQPLSEGKDEATVASQYYIFCSYTHLPHLISICTGRVSKVIYSCFTSFPLLSFRKKNHHWHETPRKFGRYEQVINVASEHGQND